MADWLDEKIEKMQRNGEQRQGRMESYNQELERIKALAPQLWERVCSAIESLVDKLNPALSDAKRLHYERQLGSNVLLVKINRFPGYGLLAELRADERRIEFDAAVPPDMPWNSTTIRVPSHSLYMNLVGEDVRFTHTISNGVSSQTLAEGLDFERGCKAIFELLVQKLNL